MTSAAALRAMNSTARKIRKTATNEIGFNQEDLITLTAKIVVFMNDHPTNARKLWHILSALRGPDAIIPIRPRQKAFPMINGEPLQEYHVKAVKAATTAVIRHAIGLTAKGEMSRLVVNPDSKTHRDLRRLLVDAEVGDTPIVEYHFLRHAQSAFEALGLDWDKVNR